MNFKTLLQDWRIITALGCVFLLFLIIIIKRKAMNTTTNNYEKKLPSEHIVSDEGIEHFKLWEGLRTKAYKDTADLWTTGIGHLIGSNEQYLITKVLTMDEVITLFKKDLRKFHNVVVSKIKVPITQGQYDALLSLAYNTGTIYNSIIALVNDGDLTALAKRWKTTAVTSKGQSTPTKGLVNRRLAETQLFA